MRRYRFVAGEYVWSGFDYLGEPSPYMGKKGNGINPHPDGWEGRSSCFGIVDLVGFPKDTYYLYRSCWKPEETTVHLSPHWNWQGHEDESIPVIVYTNGDEAELFLNGKSLGRRKKKDPDVKVFDNLAFAKRASASSEELKQDRKGNVQAENYADKAVDGNKTTRWCASDETVPQYWQVDLGILKAFRKIKIHWEASASNYTFKTQVSDDGKQWRQIAAKPKNDGNWSLLSFAEIKSRYVRITVTKCSSGWASICEVEITSESVEKDSDFQRLTHPYYDIVDSYRLCWLDVPYQPGELTAVAYKDGKKIARTSVKTAGEPAKLRLTPDRKTIAADGMDLCYVTVEMVDDKGNVCPLAMDDLTFAVEGPAKLIGTGNGNPMGHDIFTDNTHPLFYGKAMAILRSKRGKSGNARLKVNSDSGIAATAVILFVPGNGEE